MKKTDVKKTERSKEFLAEEWLEIVLKGQDKGEGRFCRHGVCSFMGRQPLTFQPVKRKPEGKAQLKEQVAYYMKNAKVIYDGLKGAGYTVSGGVNAPYIWLKTPGNMTSWEFFDHLLADANVVGTPGSGFGPSGEGYFRLTAFGTYENTVEAVERIKKL